MIEGYAGDVDSCWGNTADQSIGALPQHPLEGKDLGLDPCPGSYREQRSSVVRGVTQIYLLCLYLLLFFKYLYFYMFLDGTQKCLQ